MNHAQPRSRLRALAAALLGCLLLAGLCGCHFLQDELFYLDRRPPPPPSGPQPW